MVVAPWALKILPVPVPPPSLRPLWGDRAGGTRGRGWVALFFTLGGAHTRAAENVEARLRTKKDTPTISSSPFSHPFRLWPQWGEEDQRVDKKEK